ncbi:MAG: hypothetical protein JWM86_1478 [Thermoleophilia bacterium]|nr:hypothetical protein [Thermoleophilia bacterium]
MPPTGITHGPHATTPNQPRESTIPWKGTVMTTVSNGSAATPKQPDFFDRLGDFVGGQARDSTQRFIDRATVFSPLVGIARGIADPQGTKESYRRVGKDAADAVSVLVPGIGISRAILSTEAGRKAVADGAKGAVDIATVTNPLLAAGRAMEDPEGTRQSFERAGGAVKAFIESPFTSYGMAKHTAELVQEHPKEARQVAKTAVDVLTWTNPVMATGRVLGKLFGGD